MKDISENVKAALLAKAEWAVAGLHGVETRFWVRLLHVGTLEAQGKITTVLGPVQDGGK